MNRKLILLLSLGLVVLVIIMVKAQMPAKSPNQDSLAFQPVAVQEETFQLILGPGTIFADSNFTASSGKLISFLVNSTMAGTINFTDQTGGVISRPIVTTPNNQFYIPSDKPGEYKITFEVPTVSGSTGTYVLGILTVQGVQTQ